MAEINGVGPERAGALRRELSEQSEFLDELLSALNVKQTKGGGAAPKICFTGKMPEPRSYYEKIAAENGYEPVDHVNKELALLVARDPSASGGKLKKALAAGVNIMGIDEWLQSLQSKDSSQHQKNAPTTSSKQPVIPEDDLFGSDSKADNSEPEKKEAASEANEDGQLKLGF